ncbi:xanthine dehydrogenase family protein subunit M [Nostocoides sp. F2B08]|uniref:FAD binding domain-containing protein n=1 Tax=Nostocoides sp. F2B08 TaxID=2653936 RepID=UPI001262CE91|nr:xanthine dehydrogenase family protein subunit M [Tetrasphaera sp. F2B08]KAB7746296.1 xanthine dehydrogenase family protein subunit M [Tetrasphaera sp. F2B08]
MQVPAPFEYERAESVSHAIALLERLGDEARVVAGGHSLLPMMKLRLAAPEYLVDINDLSDELGYITVESDVVRVGALVRHAAMLAHDGLAEHFPIIRDAEHLIADPVVRNWGTLGGSLCQCDPSEDLSSVCLALDAECVITGSGGQRVVPMADFAVGPYQTAVGEAELLTEVRFPIRPGSSSAYQKVKRRAGDWPVAASGVAVRLDGGTVIDARIALTALGVDDAVDATEALVGRPPSEEAFAAAAAIATQVSRPVDDARGSAEYKRHLAGELTVRALRSAVSRALSTTVN